MSKSFEKHFDIPFKSNPKNDGSKTRKGAKFLPSLAEEISDEDNESARDTDSGWFELKLC